MENEQTLNQFYDVINKNYADFKKKMKQFCFLNSLTYSEDTLQETVLKVSEKIMKTGMTDTSEQRHVKLSVQCFQIESIPTTS